MLCTPMGADTRRQAPNARSGVLHRHAPLARASICPTAASQMLRPVHPDPTGSDDSRRAAWIAARPAPRTGICGVSSAQAVRSSASADLLTDVSNPSRRLGCRAGNVTLRRQVRRVIGEGGKVVRECWQGHRCAEPSTSDRVGRPESTPPSRTSSKRADRDMHREGLKGTPKVQAKLHTLTCAVVRRTHPCESRPCQPRPVKARDPVERFAAG